MKVVSSYYFISKVLRRTIIALRMNAIQSKFDNANNSKLKPELICNSFDAFKQNWSLCKRIKTFKGRSLKKNIGKALRVWHGVASKTVQRSQLINLLEAQQRKRTLSKVFKALSSLDSADPQTHYMSRLVLAWRKQMYRQKILN